MFTSSGYGVPVPVSHSDFRLSRYVAPFGAAKMHEFHWLFPATLSKEHNRDAILLAQVESKFGADPFFGSVQALPFDTLAWDKFRDLHIVETAIAKPELIDSPDCGRGFNVLRSCSAAGSVLVCCHHAIVGENNLSAIEFRPIRSLEPLHGR
jgi:hypothetical protein